MENQDRTETQQALPRRDAVRVFSRIGLAMALFIFIQQAVASIAYYVVAITAPQLMLTGWFTWVISYVPLYCVAFPVFWLVIKNLPQHDLGPVQPRRMTPLTFVRTYLVCVASFYIFNLITVYASALLEEATGSGIAGPAETMLQSNPWVNLFFVCVVAPVMEEIIFRQMMYKRLIAFGGKVFILFSSLMFALLHPNLYQLVYAFLIGLVLAGVRYFTNKLWPCILLHVVINFSGSGGSLLLLYYAGEEAVKIWQYVLIAFTVMGIAVAAWWLIRRRRYFVPDPGLYASPGARAMILNPGVILYMAMILALIVMTLFV